MVSGSICGGEPAEAGKVLYLLRILTYNIQAGMGVDGIRDAGRAGALAADTRIDLGGFQEVEVGSPRSRFENQPRKLSEAGGFHSAFAHGFQRGPWRFGNLVLSLFPITRSERIALPSTGEQRSMLVACVDLPGGAVHVLCTHLGLKRDERIEQMRVICEVMSGISGPLVLMGDFNDTPDSPPLAVLREAKGLVEAGPTEPTFPAPEGKAKIDYIFVRDLSPLPGSRVIQSVFSDHLPVVAEIDA